MTNVWRNESTGISHLDAVIAFLVDDWDVTPAEPSHYLHHGLHLVVIGGNRTWKILEALFVAQFRTRREEGDLFLQNIPTNFAANEIIKNAVLNFVFWLRMKLHCKVTFTHFINEKQNKNTFNINIILWKFSRKQPGDLSAMCATASPFIMYWEETF